jgi:hypothetical protein
MDYSLDVEAVTRLCLDFAVVIQTQDGTEFRLEAPFRITSADGSRSQEISPENLAESGSPLVGLLHRDVSLVTITDSGTLTLNLADGERLDCPPDEQFEAWSVVTRNGERWVSLPGTGVAHFPADPQESVQPV